MGVLPDPLGRCGNGSKNKDVESSMQIWDVQARIWDPDMAERSETSPVNGFRNLV
jgi:hypothetical protein